MEAKNERKLEPIPSGAGPITDLEQGGPHSWVGQIRILGVRHHVCLTEVVMEGDVQVPVDDADGIFAAAEAFYEGDKAYQTVKLPGVDGDFILVIHPAC